MGYSWDSPYLYQRVSVAAPLPRQASLTFRLERHARYSMLKVWLNTDLMPTMITFGRELLRIGARAAIEYSSNGGRSWHQRYSGSSAGTFRDLLAYGSEVLAITSKGIYYSSNAGTSWHMRYSGSSAGEFLSLTDGGRELLATTTKGLYYSTNAGTSWHKR